MITEAVEVPGCIKLYGVRLGFKISDSRFVHGGHISSA